MRTLTAKQIDIAKYLSDHYDYIDKITALKTCKTLCDASISDTLKAWYSIEKYQ